MFQEGTNMYKYYQPNEQDLKDQQPDCVKRFKI